MLNKVNVPREMKVAGTRPTLARAKLHYVNLIPASRCANGVQRLVQIGHKVDKKLECLDAGRFRGVPVRQHAAKNLDSVYNTVVVILQRLRMLGVWTITISLLGKSIRVPWNVDEVPARRFRSLTSNLICPG